MHRILAAFLLLLPACVKYQPPPPPEPREATNVSASMGQTWDAVIDLFALRNIPIRTIERVSGIITTENLSVDPEDGVAWGDCGKEGRVRYRPNMGIYNILVRGDSAHSTVRATVRWAHWRLKDPTLDCTSTHVYERDLEHIVKTQAEKAHRTASLGTNPNTTASKHEPSQRAEEPPATTDTSPETTRLIPRTPADGDGATVSAARTNEELLRSASFRQAVAEAKRTNVITGFRELRPDTLTVDLDDAAFSSASPGYNLGRLYLAYRGTTDYRSSAALELQLDSARVGWYTQRGLVWDR